MERRARMDSLEINCARQPFSNDDASAAGGGGGVDCERKNVMPDCCPHDHRVSLAVGYLVRQRAVCLCDDDDHDDDDYGEDKRRPWSHQHRRRGGGGE